MTANSKHIIILAAGSSSRLGTPKQSLQFRGKSLLRHTTLAAIDTGANVSVVVGANKAAVEPQFDQLALTVITNQGWEEGMASSIREAIKYLEVSYPTAGCILLTVCDQPFVSAKLFSEMFHSFSTSGKGIIACAYGDTLGTPVLFSANYFNHLLGLTGQQGARKLLDDFKDDVYGIDFPDGVIDVDTIEDYQALKKLDELL